jgi:hypothetical protein
MPNLPADHVAHCISGEVADRTSRPVHVL